MSVTLLEAAAAVVAEWERLYPGTQYKPEQLEAWEDFEFRQMQHLRAAITKAQADAGSGNHG